MHGPGRLADMLGTKGPANAPAPATQGAPAAPAQTANPSGGLGDHLRSGLGGLISGGAAGGLLSGGLNELVRRFQQNGYGDVAKSWVGTGPNQTMTPQQMNTALGPEVVNDLSRETGAAPTDLLSELSRMLPGTVDQLTPQGRVPAPQEFV
jgi:uncharacterized protein YidB (DUF937 family)